MNLDIMGNGNNNSGLTNFTGDARPRATMRVPMVRLVD